MTLATWGTEGKAVCLEAKVRSLEFRDNGKLLKEFKQGQLLCPLGSGLTVNIRDLENSALNEV